MKISMKEFNQFSSIISKAYSPDIPNRSVLFINPDEGFCSCLGKDFCFKFNFSILEPNVEGLSSFTVEITKFLALIKVYSEVTIDKDYRMVNSNDKFVLEVDPEGENSCYSFKEDDNEEYEEFILDENSLFIVKNALKFTGSEQQMESKDMNVVHMSNNSIAASDGTSIYYNVLTSSIPKPLNISSNILSVFIDLANNGFNNLKIINNSDNTMFKVIDNNNQDSFVFFGETKAPSEVLVPTKDKIDRINACFDKETYLEVERSSFTEIIDFLSPFIDDSINKPVVVECKDTYLNIIGKGKYSSSKASRVFSSDKIIKISTELVDKDFIMPQSSVLQAIKNTFTSQNIIISLGKKEGSDDFFIMQIQQDTLDNKEKVIIILIAKD